MKIALGNLRHKTAGAHSPFMPLNIAFIASYTLANIPDIDIRIYDDADKIVEDIDNWDPDILGLSNYCWNSELSSIVFKHAKKNNPNILTVAGGPNFPEYIEECEKYLLNKEEIDFYAYRDGEKAFCNLVKFFLNDSYIDKLKEKKMRGLMHIHPKSKKIVKGKETLCIKNLDIIPSPYLNHLLDPWFNGYYAPSIETTRGCPFSCQYCHTGNDCYNFVGKFSVDRTKKELTYIAEKMIDNPNIVLSICDTNFGIYKKDKEIINYICGLQKKYKWPINFDVTTGKGKYKEILQMIKQLGGTMRLDCAIQSMNPLTLEFIKRRNLPILEYEGIQKQAKKNNIVSVAELIMPLPYETEKTFLDGMKKIMNSGIEYIYPYTTMLLPGTPLSNNKNRKKYNMKSKFRLLPRMFGEYDRKKCFEVEEVCVSTNTFSFDEYIRCRGIILISYLLGSDQVDIISVFIKDLKISNFDFIYNVWLSIIKKNTKISKIYKEYIAEVKKELWDSKEEIYNYFSQQNNYDKLLKGEMGDNLVRKYKTKILLEQYEDVMSLFYSIIEDIGGNKITKEIRNFLRDSKKWVIKIREMRFLLKGEIENKIVKIDLSYDVNRWYKDKKTLSSLSLYKKKVKYLIHYKNIDELNKKVNQRKKLFGDDYFYSIGKIMMDGRINYFWRNCEYSNNNRN